MVDRPVSVPLGEFGLLPRIEDPVCGRAIDCDGQTRCNARRGAGKDERQPELRGGQCGAGQGGVLQSAVVA